MRRVQLWPRIALVCVVYLPLVFVIAFLVEGWRAARRHSAEVLAVVQEAQRRAHRTRARRKRLHRRRHR